jgi:hypothetical protein
VLEEVIDGGTVKKTNLKYQRMIIKQKIGRKKVMYHVDLPLIPSSNPNKQRQQFAEQIAAAIEDVVKQLKK